MTILKALKDRIRSMGGETNATNIADAIKDLPKGGSSELPPEVTNAVETHGMGWTDEDETVHQIDEKYIPSSGSSELPPEVTNAVETNGMGWTDEEEVPAINITWDGNTDGRESFGEVFYKVSDLLIDGDVLSDSTTVKYMANGQEYIATIEDISKNPDGKEWDIQLSGEYISEEYSLNIYLFGENMFGASIGVYFNKTYPGSDVYVSSLEIPATTQEVVHQIDSKYIPSSGGAVVVNFEITYDEEAEETYVTADMTPSEVLEAMKTNVVIGVGEQGGEILPLGNAMMANFNLSPCFAMIKRGISDYEISLFIESDKVENVWEAVFI